MIELLLHAGAKINMEDPDGKTPIHLPSLLGCDLEVLIQAGADIHHKDNTGSTPLHKASSVGTVKALLRDGADVHSRDNYGLTPLHMAWSAEVAETLLSAGADVNSRDAKDMTPLHCIPRCSKGRALAEVLVNAGADLNTRADHQAMTPLSWIQTHKPRQRCSYPFGPSRRREAAFVRCKAEHAELVAFLQQCGGTV